MPDWVSTIMGSEERVTARELVEEVAQRNLKAVLGGQFTEREGEKLIKRAFNPTLSEQENVKRVSRLINQIQEAALDKERMFQYARANNGNMSGFEPRSSLMKWKYEGDESALEAYDEGTASSIPEEKLKPYSPRERKKIERVYMDNAEKGFSVDDVIKGLTEKGKITSIVPRGDNAKP